MVFHSTPLSLSPSGVEEDFASYHTQVIHGVDMQALVQTLHEKGVHFETMQGSLGSKLAPFLLLCVPFVYLYLTYRY